MFTVEMFLFSAKSDFAENLGRAVWPIAQKTGVLQFGYSLAVFAGRKTWV